MINIIYLLNSLLFGESMDAIKEFEIEDYVNTLIKGEFTGEV